MKPILTLHSTITFAEDGYNFLATHVQDSTYSKIVLLVDSNTHKYCLNRFLKYAPFLRPDAVLEIPAGEEAKNLDSCNQLWRQLMEHGLDRSSLLINLGGGVVTDLGGFVASTYMRGISFINVPTSLLAMVDASVGGKTGVDLGLAKNMVGTFAEPYQVLIDTAYLETLPARDLRSGKAEMIKHGVIRDAFYYHKLKEIPWDYLSLVYHSVQLKNEIVAEDWKESGFRKILNFGHTLGHAIESHFLSKEDGRALLHGEAIAAGMVMEAYLSYRRTDFPKEELADLCTYLTDVFGKLPLTKDDRDPIIKWMRYDKKNKDSVVRFVLLSRIGEACFDVEVEDQLIYEAIDYYHKI